MPVSGMGSGRAGRRINNACKESTESRAALARMKSHGAFLTGAKKATDKQEKRCARGISPCALRAAGARRIGRNGSQAAKPDIALPGAGRSAGIRAGGVERAKAGAKGCGGGADTGKPGFVHQQQRKSGAYRAFCDASATGYVCGEGACNGRTVRQEGTSATGTRRQGSGSEACRG